LRSLPILEFLVFWEIKVFGETCGPFGHFVRAPIHVVTSPNRRRERMHIIPAGDPCAYFVALEAVDIAIVFADGNFAVARYRSAPPDVPRASFEPGRLLPVSCRREKSESIKDLEVL